MNVMCSCLIVFAALGCLVAAQAEDRPMIYIPAGEFVMGTTKKGAAALAKQYCVHRTVFLSETPQRKVNVKAFWIDQYPVTNAQYKRFVDATNSPPPRSWRGKSCPRGKRDHPVGGLNWHQAAAYAEWAGKRLPTAEEWEKAARGTDGRLYPWGNEWDHEATRIDDGTSPQTRANTTPVGCFLKGASPYRVMDMCGNVAEWTCTQNRKSDPKRKWAWYVIKGASAAQSQRYNFRCAAHNFSAHTSRVHDWLGFRCAMDADGTQPKVKGPAPLSGKPVPPIPPAEGPREDLYGTRPIRLRPGGIASMTFDVACFPAGGLTTFVPEQAGAAGMPLAWAAGRPRSQWKTSKDGTLAQYAVTWPGKATMTVTLESGIDYVDFTIAIRNLTHKTFKRVGTNTCFNPGSCPYFADMERHRSYVWTDDGPTRMIEMPCGSSGEYLHGGWAVAKPTQKAPKRGSRVRHPFCLLVSRDGKFIVAQAYGEGTTIGTNAHYSCLHSRPTWPDIAPGQEASRKGKLYFVKASLDQFLERWKKDFGK